MSTKSLFNVYVGSNFLQKFINAGVNPFDECVLVFCANCRSLKFSSHSLWTFSRCAFIAVFIYVLHISVKFDFGWYRGVFECLLPKFCVNFTMILVTNSVPLSVNKILAVPPKNFLSPISLKVREMIALVNLF